VGTAPTTTADSITAVFTSVIDAGHAPRVTTSAEHFVFSHAYEPLIRVDCGGQASSGLAKSWTSMDGGATWRFVLRADARFWNGDRISAHDVMASWRATGQHPVAVLARHLGERATVVDDTTIDVQLGRLPLTALGDAELGVARQQRESRWPEGSGPYRVRNSAGESLAAARPSTFVLDPVEPGATPRIVVHTSSESGARDLADLGADLVITEDRALFRYVSGRGGTWRYLHQASEMWALVSRGAATDTTPVTMPRTAYELGAGLARDVVRAHARPSVSARWSLRHLVCDPFVPPPPTQPPGTLGSTRIVYRRDEPIARAIAERLVALAAAGDEAATYVAPGLVRAGARATAVGLPPNDFDSALRDGRELAFVVPVRRRPNLQCEQQPLLHLAPWLGSQTSSGFVPIVVSLIETNPAAVVTTTRARFILTWNGTLVVARP
jgi:hypothetical protein